MRGKWWQAYRELLGRPGRNIIISICIFILTLFCGGATFCDSAIECFCETFANIANNCVLVEIDDYSTLDDWNSLLGYIKMNESVKGYNNAFTSDIICQALDFKNYPYNESEHDFDSDKVFISGRSIGDVNVQIILEKLGGGGHITLAGAQLEGLSIEDAKHELIIRINEYLLENE